MREIRPSGSPSGEWKRTDRSRWGVATVFRPATLVVHRNVRTAPLLDSTNNASVKPASSWFSPTLREIFPEGLSRENRGKTNASNSKCGIRSAECHEVRTVGIQSPVILTVNLQKIFPEAQIRENRGKTNDKIEIWLAATRRLCAAERLLAGSAPLRKAFASRLSISLRKILPEASSQVTRGNGPLTRFFVRRIHSDHFQQTLIDQIKYVSVLIEVELASEEGGLLALQQVEIVGR